MVTGVVVEIIAVIIAADAYAAIPVKIIVITIIIAALIHVPDGCNNASCRQNNCGC